MLKRLLAIDGNSLMHRAYYALPASMTAPDGSPTNAVFGFLSMLLRALDSYEPDALAVAFDMHGPTFRHEYYPEYKAGRRETPEDLRPQFPMLKELLQSLGVVILEARSFEADDILGTLAAAGEQQGTQVVLMTGDKDALQLISATTMVALTRRGVTDVEEYTPEHLDEVWGITADKVPDLKGLMGDNSDNIPGIPGVGEKTALKLLGEYGSLEEVLAHAQQIKGKLGERVQAGHESARLSYKLAVILRNAPVPLEMEHYRFDGFAPDGRNALQDLQLNQILQRAQMRFIQGEEKPEVQVEEGSQSIRIETLQALPELFASFESPVALSLREDAIEIASGERSYSMPLRQTLMDEGFEQGEALLALAPLFGEGFTLVLHDVKAWMHRMYAVGVQMRAHSFDTMIAQYVLQPLERDYSQARLGTEYTGRGDCAARELLQICQQQRDRLQQTQMLELYQQIEEPLIWVLFAMECEGFTLQRSVLQELQVDFDARIEILTREIWNLGGGEFNINSSKQLSEVLFERLGLPPIKKTRTGYSTDASVLEQLEDKSPIIRPILNYRQLAKLKSTYVDALLNLCGMGDGRIHTTFNQAVTSTGRISSSEPNLQNIPVRDEEGRQIRRAFIGHSEDHVLVDGDYSQIELRVLAHMAQDERMCQAFLDGDDIHTRTASEVFGVPLDEVTSQMRSAAKAVNFGIVYGISDFGLSRQLGITRTVAGEYIDRYLRTYSGVKSFMENCVQRAREEGYISTLFGRRRPAPELKSANYVMRSFGERAVMNAPIQGTAADIIKLAMIRVHKALGDGGYSSKLILQVHDELIIDTHPQELEAVMELLRREMQQVVELRVPLQADVSYGKSWFEAK